MGASEEDPLELANSESEDDPVLESVTGKRKRVFSASATMNNNKKARF